MNVVAFNSNREAVLIEEIRRGHEREGRGREEWIEGVWSQCAALAEARDRHPDNISFGVWLAQNGIDFYSPPDRAAYITLYRAGEAGRVALVESPRRSVRGIVEHDLPLVQARYYNAVITAPVDANVADSPVESAVSLEVDGQDSCNSVDAVAASDPTPAVAAPVVTPPAVYRPTRGTPKLVELLGDECGGTIYSYFKGPGSPLLNVFVRLCAHDRGKRELRRLAQLLSTGDYGPRQNGKAGRFGPRPFFDNLPTSWANMQTSERVDVKALKDLIDDLPLYKRISDALRTESPANPHKFCADFYRNAKTPPRAVTVREIAPPVEVIAVNSEGDTATVPSSVAPVAASPDPHESLYCGSPADRRFDPWSDDDITVCGVTIYRRGTALDWDEYAEIWFAYRFVMMMDMNMRRGEPSVVQRGVEYKRLSIYFGRTKRVASKIMWKIGKAMEDFPDKFATETRAAPGGS